MSRLKIDNALEQSANRIRPFQIGSLPVFTQFACSSEKAVTLNGGCEVKTGFDAMMAAEWATLQQTSSLTKKQNMVPGEEEEVFGLFRIKCGTSEQGQGRHTVSLLYERAGKRSISHDLDGATRGCRGPSLGRPVLCELPPPDSFTRSRGPSWLAGKLAIREKNKKKKGWSARGIISSPNKVGKAT